MRERIVVDEAEAVVQRIERRGLTSPPLATRETGFRRLIPQALHQIAHAPLVRAAVPQKGSGDLHRRVDGFIRGDDAQHRSARGETEGLAADGPEADIGVEPGKRPAKSAPTICDGV